MEDSTLAPGEAMVALFALAVESVEHGGGCVVLTRDFFFGYGTGDFAEQGGGGFAVDSENKFEEGRWESFGRSNFFLNWQEDPGGLGSDYPL